MSADEDKKWTYTIGVDASTVVDTAPPELIAGYTPDRWLRIAKIQ